MVGRGRHLTLSTNNIEKISSLSGMENLRILSLGRNLIKKIENLDAVADTLEELWLSYNQVVSLVSHLPPWGAGVGVGGVGLGQGGDGGGGGWGWGAGGGTVASADSCVLMQVLLPTTPIQRQSAAGQARTACTSNTYAGHPARRRVGCGADPVLCMSWVVPRCMAWNVHACCHVRVLQQCSLA